MGEVKKTKSGVLIKHAGDGMLDISVLRGRDVTYALKDSNVDPRVVRLLYQLAEGHHEMRKMVKELVSMTEQLVDTVATVGLAVEGAHKKLQEFKREPMVDETIVTNPE